MFPAMSRCPEPFVRQPLSGLEDHLEREGQSTEHLEILRRTIWGQRLSALALGVKMEMPKNIEPLPKISNSSLYIPPVSKNTT